MAGSVAFVFAAFVIVNKLTGHSEVYHEGLLIVQINYESFAEATNFCNGGAFYCFGATDKRFFAKDFCTFDFLLNGQF